LHRSTQKKEFPATEIDRFKASPPYSHRFRVQFGQPPQNRMPFLMDKILAEYADQAYEPRRLGRNGVHTTDDLVLAETLAKLEASGDAMRLVDAEGRIAWKATPDLCQYLQDLEFDALEDLEDI
jgi:hypothetical protein